MMTTMMIKDHHVPSWEYEDSDDFEIPLDAFSCDDFRMFEFKVKKCTRARSHDWTECPFAHPGEKARRRDPRKCHYSGRPCPDFRKGACKRGDACEYAHGVFECWLHPARYRTEPCKDGVHCRRRVCFFAHSPEQLRVLPCTSPDKSPRGLGQDSFVSSRLFGSSRNRTLYSPPASPTTWSAPVSRSDSVNQQLMSQLTESVRGLRVSEMNIGLGSPRSPQVIRPGFMSLPSTPIGALNRPGNGAFDLWETSCKEKGVDSGKELSEKLSFKLGMEDRIVRVDSQGPDVWWISELLNESDSGNRVGRITGLPGFSQSLCC